MKYKMQHLLAISLFGIGLFGLSFGHFHLQKEESIINRIIEDKQQNVQTRSAVHGNGLHYEILQDIYDHEYNPPENKIEGSIKIKSERGLQTPYQAPDKIPDFDESLYQFFKEQSINIHQNDDFKMKWQLKNNNPTLLLSGSINSDKGNTNYENYLDLKVDVFNVDIGPLNKVQLFGNGVKEVKPNYDFTNFAYYINSIDSYEVNKNLENALKENGRSKGFQKKEWKDGGLVTPYNQTITYFFGGEDFRSGYSSPFHLFSGQKEYMYRTKYQGIDNKLETSLRDFIIKSFAFKNIDTLMNLINVDFTNLPLNDRGNIWSGATIEKVTKASGVFSFGDVMYYLKTFDFVRQTLDRLYYDVFLVNTKNTEPEILQLFKDFFHFKHGSIGIPAQKIQWPVYHNQPSTDIWLLLDWNKHSAYKKERVKALVEALYSLKWSSFQALEQTVNNFFLDPTHPFTQFPFEDNKDNFNTVYSSNLKENLIMSKLDIPDIKGQRKTIYDSWSFKAWSDFYRMLTNVFKNYDLVTYFEVYNLKTNSWETVQTEPDANGKTNNKQYLLLSPYYA